VRLGIVAFGQDQRPARAPFVRQVCRPVSITDQLRPSQPPPCAEPCFEWGKLERPVKITLAKGERQRDRVLTGVEWGDTARFVRNRGRMLQCSFAAQECALAKCLLFGGRIGTGGLIQVTEGKTKAARRMLPMVPLSAFRFEGKMGSSRQTGRGLDIPIRFAGRPLEQGHGKGPAQESD